MSRRNHRRKANRSPESSVSRDPVERQASSGAYGRRRRSSWARPPTHRAYSALAREAIDGKETEIYDALEIDVPVSGNWTVPMRLLAETRL